MQPEPLPAPPAELVHRTGWLGEDVPLSEYERLSSGVRELIEAILPPGWDWSGKRVLDFGCGAGRVLRQFAPDASSAEFWGCDIHAPSVAWMTRNLCPPFHAFQCSEEPGLPLADGYFDLVYAMSVYTHITDHWAGWLLEHQRVLGAGGLLLVSFLGEGMMDELIGERWNEDDIGMNALLAGTSFDQGGPMVFHSPWWLRAHWGRAFDVVRLLPHTGQNAPAGHGLILLRRKRVALTVADLERPEPDEPREAMALAHHVKQLQRDIVELRSRNQSIERSRSWRITAPIRGAMRTVRGGKPR